MHIVALAIADGVSLFELAAPIAVFGPPLVPGVAPRYELRVCSGPHDRVDRYFQVASTSRYDDLATADTVIVAACHDQRLVPPAELVAAVGLASRRGARIASICTGAFVLAAAGLLDHRRATTHWAYLDLLAERHPDVRVEADVLYVDDGDVLTSAGKAAGMDLCLHVVRRDHGAAVANAIARMLVTPPHRAGGQAQYVAPVDTTSDDALGPLLDWALEHLHQGIGVSDLAQRAAVNTRTLSRHFNAQLGTSPHRWLLGQRVRRAQELLERTNDSIEAIAVRSGFGTATLLRRHVRAALGVPPDAYRRTFRGPPQNRRRN